LSNGTVKSEIPPKFFIFFAAVVNKILLRREKKEINRGWKDLIVKKGDVLGLSPVFSEV